MHTNNLSQNLDPPDDGRIVEEEESDSIKNLREEEKIM